MCRSWRAIGCRWETETHVRELGFNIHRVLRIVDDFEAAWGKVLGGDEEGCSFSEYTRDKIFLESIESDISSMNY